MRKTDFRRFLEGAALATTVAFAGAALPSAAVAQDAAAPAQTADVDDMDEAGDEDVCETGPCVAGEEPATGPPDDRTDFMTTAGGGDRDPGGGAADVVRSCGELMPFGVADAEAVTSYLHWTPPATDGMPTTLLLSADDMGDMAPPPPGDGRPPTPPPPPWCCKCCRWQHTAKTSLVECSAWDTERSNRQGYSAY